MLWRKVFRYKLFLKAFCSAFISNASLKKSVVSHWLWWDLGLVFDGGGARTAIRVFKRAPANAAIAALQD